MHCLLIACTGVNDEKTREAIPSRLIFLSNDQNRTQHYCHPVVRPRNDWNRFEDGWYCQATKTRPRNEKSQEKLTLVEIVMAGLVFRDPRHKAHSDVPDNQA